MRFAFAPYGTPKTARRGLADVAREAGWRGQRECGGQPYEMPSRRPLALHDPPVYELAALGFSILRGIMDAPNMTYESCLIKSRRPASGDG